MGTKWKQEARVKESETRRKKQNSTAHHHSWILGYPLTPSFPPPHSRRFISRSIPSHRPGRVPESDQNYSHHFQVQVPKAWARYPSMIHTSQDAPRGVSSLVPTCPSPLLRGSTPGGLARLVQLSRKSNTQKQGGKLSSPCPMRCDPPCSDYLCLSRTWLPCKPTKQKRAWAGLWGHSFFPLAVPRTARQLPRKIDDGTMALTVPAQKRASN